MRGFTLIELLAVILILTLLVTLTSVSVIKLVNNSKSEIYTDIEKKSIIKSAEMWGADNINKLPSSGCIYITLDTLINSKLLNSDIENIINQNNETSLYVKIELLNNNYTYTLENDIPSGCLEET